MKTNNMNSTMIRVDNDVKDIIMKLAEDYGYSQSTIIRMLISDKNVSNFIEYNGTPKYSNSRKALGISFEKEEIIKEKPKKTSENTQKSTFSLIRYLKKMYGTKIYTSKSGEMYIKSINGDRWTEKKLLEEGYNESNKDDVWLEEEFTPIEKNVNADSIDNEYF